MKKPLWKRGWVWVVVVLLMLSAFGSKNTKKQEQSENFTASEIETKKDEKEDIIPLEDCIVQLEATVSSVYENYELHLSEDKKSLLIYLWQDGLAVEATKAKADISPYDKAWESLVNDMKELSLSVQDFMDTNGYPDVRTSICVRNDLNLEGTMLMVHNGRVLLDAVND